MLCIYFLLKGIIGQGAALNISLQLSKLICSEVSNSCTSTARLPYKSLISRFNASKSVLEFRRFSSFKVGRFSSSESDGIFSSLEIFVLRRFSLFVSFFFDLFFFAWDLFLVGLFALDCFDFTDSVSLDTLLGFSEQKRMSM